MKEERSSKCRLKTLRTNNGTKYFSISKFYKDNSIIHQTIVPYAHSQVNIGKRINLTMLNKIRTLLFTAKLFKKL